VKTDRWLKKIRRATYTPNSSTPEELLRPNRSRITKLLMEAAQAIGFTPE